MQDSLLALVVGWLSAFLFGQAIEVPIYVVAQRPRPWPFSALVGFGATLLSHPVVWFVFPWLIPDPERYVTMAILAESFAVSSEALYFWLWGMRPRRAVVASLVANGASLSLGLLSRELFGWP